MNNIQPAFEGREKGLDQMPIRYQEVKCPLNFDVKINENFQKLAQYVPGQHTTTEVPTTLMYNQEELIGILSHQVGSCTRAS